MNEQFSRFVEVLKPLTTLTTRDLIKLCYEDPILPSNVSTIYFLISLAVSYDILKKVKRGSYIVNHKKRLKFIKRWGSDEGMFD